MSSADSASRRAAAAPGLIYEYDPAGDKWTKKKTMPSGAPPGAEAVYQNKIYIFGGCLKAITGEGATTNACGSDGRPTDF